ncbi:hypothetical protein MKUB_09870 [Mycobacterium kubicae]|uniref:Anti-sigma factor antagonist n=2 Tax=Mycobacterium kubicae TaxID=120959 RepID=A0ABQ1BIJ5_9MYCO|nr:hypothetical protein MKUB_09870 [Mycobacterium kubicae]
MRLWPAHAAVRAPRLTAAGNPEALKTGQGMELLAVEHAARDDAIFVHVKGDVDSSTVDELVTHLTEALRLAATHPAQLVIVDLKAVTFFGSAGLNAILDCHEAGVAAGTSVRLVADHAQVLQPIEVTLLNRIFDIYPTVDDALQRDQPTED